MATQITVADFHAAGKLYETMLLRTARGIYELAEVTPDEVLGRKSLGSSQWSQVQTILPSTIVYAPDFDKAPVVR